MMPPFDEYLAANIVINAIFFAIVILLLALFSYFELQFLFVFTFIAAYVFAIYKF